MATTDYGTKYQCFKCGTRFYDLHRPQPICPKCRSNQKDAPPEPEPGKAGREPKRAVEEVEEAEVPEVDLALDEEELPLDEESLEEDEEAETDET